MYYLYIYLEDSTHHCEQFQTEIQAFVKMQDMAQNGYLRDTEDGLVLHPSNTIKLLAIHRSPISSTTK